MTVNQYNADQELTLDEQSEVILTCSDIAGEAFETIEQSIAYAMEDEIALESISHIADFGL